MFCRLQLAAIPLLDPDHVAKERVSVFPLFFPSNCKCRHRFLITEFLFFFVVGLAETLQGETGSRSRAAREARAEGGDSTGQHVLYLVELG